MGALDQTKAWGRRLRVMGRSGDGHTQGLCESRLVHWDSNDDGCKMENKVGLASTVQSNAHAADGIDGRMRSHFVFRIFTCPW